VNTYADVNPIQVKGAWILLYHLAPVGAQHISPGFALKYWNRIRSGKMTKKVQEKGEEEVEGSTSISLQVLNVLGYVTPWLGQARQNVVEDVVSQLLGYEVEPMKIQAYVQVLVRLCNNKKDLIKQWASQLFESCIEVCDQAFL
jgi:hypothetical protein